MRPKALILHANGINRDLEAANALEVAGAEVDIVHLNQLRKGDAKWEDYQILCLPGGFSYADALGAGKLMALEMNVYFTDALREFVESGKPVIGICNGFQALVKSGILPDIAAAKPAAAGRKQPVAKGKAKVKAAPKAKASPNAGRATLTFNESGRFECRWIYLKPVSQKCVWTRDLEELVYCPVAHGEGRFLLGDPKELKTLEAGRAAGAGVRLPRRNGSQRHVSRQPQRILRRHRRDLQREGQRARADAAPRGSHLRVAASPFWTRRTRPAGAGDLPQRRGLRAGDVKPQYVLRRMSFRGLFRGRGIGDLFVTSNRFFNGRGFRNAIVRAG